MGHSQQDKVRNHERIVKAAAERFRECGVDGIGVADLMKEAGLSHGGFYRHFPSRDDLVAEAVEHALADGGRRLADVARSGARARAAYSKQVEAYLNLLTELVGGPNRKSKRAKAITVLAALVGAVSMARAVKEEKLSREILASTAQDLIAMLRT